MRKNKKRGQTLATVLFIMVTLTGITVKTAENASLAIKESKRHRESAKAYYLAKSGINYAIDKIQNRPKNGYYKTDNDQRENGEKLGLKYQISDEAGKFNINNNSDLGQLVLEQLFIIEGNMAEEEAKELAKDCMPAIGKKELMNKLELLTILEEYYQKKGRPEPFSQAKMTYSDIADFIRVAGEKEININTASPGVLKSLVTAAVKYYLSDSINQDDINLLLTGIIQLRQGSSYFQNTDTQEIKDKLASIDHSLNGAEENIVSALCDNKLICVDSEIFNIVALGNSGNIQKLIEIKYDSKADKIIDWYEK